MRCHIYLKKKIFFLHLVNANKSSCVFCFGLVCFFVGWIFCLFVVCGGFFVLFCFSDDVILVKLYNTVMISFKSHINPAVQIFHFLQPSYNTLLSYGANFLCNASFHGIIICMNTDIYMYIYIWQMFHACLFFIFLSKIVLRLCKLLVLQQFC